MRRGKLGLISLIIIVATVMIGATAWLSSKIIARTQSSAHDQQATAVNQLLQQPTADSKVFLTIRGPITAKENHYSVLIEVTQSSRKLYIYQGYDQTVVDKVELDNHPKSFADFLLSLKNNDFAAAKQGKQNQNDATCADGQLIQFGLDKGTQTVKHYWLAPCSGDGTFAGNASVILNLIKRQIPRAQAIINQSAPNLDGLSNRFSLQF